MGNFNLVQRGTFVHKAYEGSGLTGCTGVVKLDHMGPAEFGGSAIPKAFRRIMWHYKVFGIYPTGLKTPSGEEVMVFCRQDRATKTVEAIKAYVDQSWMLKTASYLPCVIQGAETSTNFWWCIDIPKAENVPDWIAFLASKEEMFKAALENDYNHWWLRMSEKEREKEYRASCCW